MSGSNILIIDDEDDIRKLIRGILEDEGFQCREAETSTQSFDRLAEQIPDLIILDIWLQGSELDGIGILERLKKDHPSIPVIMISGHGTIETAVQAIKIGAYDFIEKPFKSDRLLLMIHRALETATLKRENEELRNMSETRNELTGCSPSITAFQHALERVGPTNSRVLLTGEPGTGKDICARLIHALSNRANKPYMVLNCATMHPAHIETELFGTEEQDNENAVVPGMLEKANGGTLVLDEVADMPLETQGKIVRVLQSQRYHRIGGNTEISVNIRILATTNKDLQIEIENGNFRQDLYYRLNVVPLELPPLHERREDIPALVACFQSDLRKSAGSGCAEFSENAMRVLQAYKWPGNVRQLRNVVEWVMIMFGSNDGRPYDVGQLPSELFPAGKTGIPATVSPDNNGAGFQMDQCASLSLREARELFEQNYLKLQIEKFHGNVSKTAKFVGMERSALHRKMKSLNITTSGENTNAMENEHSEETITRKKAG